MKPTISAEDIHVGDKVVITIKRLGINGEGVGYFRRKAVFIEGALPSEVVQAKVTHIEAKHLQAEIIKIEKRSPDRISSDCGIFEKSQCGGCQLWHFRYAEQLKQKEELIRESFRRYVGENRIPVIRPMIGMEHPEGYRNKAQYQLGMNASGEVIAGLFKRNSHELIDLTPGCRVQPEALNQALAKITEEIRLLKIPAGPSSKERNGLRSVVIRIGDGDTLQVTLISYSDRVPRVHELVERIRSVLPQVKCIALNVNSNEGPLMFGEQTRTLWGNDTMDVTLGHLTVSLSPRSFFQLNTSQTVKLYDAVKEAANLTGTELLIDAYCGSGTIGLWLAAHAREVRGIETIADAVLDARANARRNSIENASFFVGKTEELLPTWLDWNPDVIVVDPPRSGCDRQLLQAIIRSRVNKLVYVSCNPSTLAKESQVLIAGGFRIEYVQPVDMFPQTAHVECVCLLVRQK